MVCVTASARSLHRQIPLAGEAASNLTAVDPGSSMPSASVATSRPNRSYTVWFTRRVRAPKVRFGGITRILSAGAGASADSSA
jgi:hypothetical protein